MYVIGTVWALLSSDWLSFLTADGNGPAGCDNGSCREIMLPRLYIYRVLVYLKKYILLQHSIPFEKNSLINFTNLTYPRNEHSVHEIE